MLEYPDVLACFAVNASRDALRYNGAKAAKLSFCFRDVVSGTEGSRPVD